MNKIIEEIENFKKVKDKEQVKILDELIKYLNSVNVKLSSEFIISAKSKLK